jgi:hypothetical protein
VNLLVFSMLISAGISGAAASFKQRSPALWLSLGLFTGPIAVALILLLPSRKTQQEVLPAGTPRRSIAEEIHALEEMRERGIITDDEFTQGKVQTLAWPVSSPIPAALTPHRVWADGRRTWASYQPATRAAFVEFACRHALNLAWRTDLPLELACTFPIQPGLSLEFTLGLDKGMIHFFGEGWDLDAIELSRPEQGLPVDLELVLNALVEGSGRVVILRAYDAPSPFWVSLQRQEARRWRTILRRRGMPVPPVWRRTVVSNEDARR